MQKSKMKTTDFSDATLFLSGLISENPWSIFYGLSLVKRLRRVRSLKMTKAKKARMQTKATW